MNAVLPEVIESPRALRARIAGWRARGWRIAFVPTMGNLHEGHLDLVRKAKTLGDRVVVSLFVNPLQFGPNEDFARYPRSFEADREKLAALAVDLLFAPREESLYPHGREQLTRVIPPALGEWLEGAFRPGFFHGVATVVGKLFNLVQPDVAVFGEKDFQQLLVVRKMVADLDFPVVIESAPTRREADGLAMSSRNAYLDAQARQTAPLLYASLQQAKRRIEAGEAVNAVEQAAIEALQQAGFAVDYFTLRRADDLLPPDFSRAGAEHSGQALVLLAAARLGATRLIDNLAFELKPTGG